MFDGKICSVFLMIELVVVSSDVCNIEIIIFWDGVDYVINGCKWWMLGVVDLWCKIFIVMGCINLDVVVY